MPTDNLLPPQLLSAREAAAYLHISLFTLKVMERRRLVIPYRTPGGHRRYSLEMLNNYLVASRVVLPTPEPHAQASS